MSHKNNMKTRIMVWILCIATVFTTVNLPVFAIGANAEEINEETYIGSEDTNVESDVDPVEENPSCEDASEEMADEDVTDEVENAIDEVGDVTEDADESAADETAEDAADDVTDEASEEKTGEDSEAVSEEIIEDGICGSSVDNTPAKDNSTGEYIITSAEELKWFADYIATTSNSAKARLNNSIDLPDFAYYANLMIGSKDKPFAGTFDGNGNTISNVKINSMLKSGNCSYAGLFAYVAGTSANHAVIKNLTVEGMIDLTNSSPGAGGTENYVGGIVGTAYAYTDIDNIVSSVYINANMGSKAHIGGIVGSTEWNDNPGGTPINISRASFSGMISTNCTDATGGIIGYIQKGKITDCINTAMIFSSSSLGNVCGILGYINNETSGSFEMKNCVSAGSVSGGANTAVFVCYKNCPSRMFSGLYYDSELTAKIYVRIEGGADISTSKVVSCNSDKMSSGEVTWALNGSKSSGDLVWYQRLGENGDPYPSIRKAEDGSNTVYYSYADCEADEKTYSNNEGLSTKGHGSWNDGKCGYCGSNCLHGGAISGICNICGMQIYVSYIYPVYNIEKDPTSGIKEWKEGIVQPLAIIGTSDTTLGIAGEITWYVVNSEMTISNSITVNGDVNIILVVGANLTVNGSSGEAGINVSGPGNSLTIYGQANGSGELTVKSARNGAGIGGCNGTEGGNITINGGTVNATGGNGGAGIGGGFYTAGTNITINGGSIEATGGDSGAGIGGGYAGEGSNITINGGVVTAQGGSGAAGVGGGYGRSGSGITMASGLVVKGGNGESSETTVVLGESNWSEILSGLKYVTIHTHKFEDKWSTDTLYHWHKCITEGAEDSCIMATGAAMASHGSWKNGICGTCGYECSHTWESGICKTCGYECFHGGAVVGICSICGLMIKEIPYRYPEYNIENDHTSGIRVWKNGSAECVAITSDDTTLGVTGTTTWYFANGELTISSTVTVNGDVNIILADGAKITIIGLDEKAGMNVSGEGNSLTIYGQEKGSGELKVFGGEGGAGIGGDYHESGDNITINGGRITAEGRWGGSGIGGGNYGEGNNITINGGTVKAKGGVSGAGIGGGGCRDGSNITVNGGNITAEGDHYSAGIGGGEKGDGSNITISEELFVKAGTDRDSAMLLNAENSTWDNLLSGKLFVYIALHMHEFANEWSSDDTGHWHECTAEGALKTCVNEIGASNSPHSLWINGKCGICGYECKHKKNVGALCEICGKQVFVSVSYIYPEYNTENDSTSGIKEWKTGTRYCIPITASYTSLGIPGEITWYVVNSMEAFDMTISGTISVSGQVNIILADGAKLTITGSPFNAGINVSENNCLFIYGQEKGSGELKVFGGSYSAGIGGGYRANGANIIINGGSVTAIGGDYGAGIGGGHWGTGSNIIINGGSVTAIGGDYGASIGGGHCGTGSNIIINGGSVTATGAGGGAGIGGGYCGDGNNITINGGKIEATVSSRGAGIGGGYRGSGSEIIIASWLIVKAGANMDSAIDITLVESTWAEQLSDKTYVNVKGIGAKYSGCSLSLSGDIAINIYMDLDAEARTDTIAKLIINNNGTVTEIPLAVAEKVVDETSEGKSESTRYIFHYSIPAKDYGNELTCKFVRSDIEGHNFTVKVSDYIDYIQENSSKYDKKTVDLANAMEMYCAAAESYFAVNAQTAQESQANQQVQYDYSAVAGELSSYSADYTKMGESYLGSSLVLNGKVTIRHYYSDNAVFAQLGITDYKSVGDIYYYEIEDISPDDYDAVQANGYSVYSYIYSGLSCDGCSDKLKNLLCAMYDYSVAAEAYVLETAS